MTLFDSFCSATQFCIIAGSLLILLIKYADDDEGTLSRYFSTPSTSADITDTEKSDLGTNKRVELMSQRQQSKPICDSLPYPVFPADVAINRKSDDGGIKADPAGIANSESGGNSIAISSTATATASSDLVEMCGLKIHDRFQWLEETHSSGVQQWLQQQKLCTDIYFSSMGPVKEIFEQKMLAAQSFEDIEAPFHMGNRYFFYKRLFETDDQMSLFCTYDLRSEAILVFNPNAVDVSYDEATMSSTYSYTSSEVDYNSSIVVFAVWLSHDGHQLAFGYARSFESATMSIGIKNVRIGEYYLDDTLSNCSVRQTSVAWLRSAFGFFYTLHEVVAAVKSESTPTDAATAATTATAATANAAATNTAQRFCSKVLFHRIGSTQKDDIVVFETITENAAITLNVQITHDGHYLLLDIFKSRHNVSANSLYRSCIAENCSPRIEGNKLYYFDLTHFDGQSVDTIGQCTKLIDTFAYRFEYITNIEEDFWFRTNYQAANFRVVRVTFVEEIHQRVEPERIAHTLFSAWKDCLDWIPERLEGDYLEAGSVAAQTVLVLKYLRNCSHEVLLYDLTQTLLAQSQIPVADLPHPSFGTISNPNCDYFSDEIFYKFSSLSDPGSIYRAVITREPVGGSIEFSFDQINSTSIPGVDKYCFDTVEEFCKSNSNQQIPLLIFGEMDAFAEPRRPLPCVILPSCGFGVPLTPRFSLPLMILARYFNVLIVLANLQGSGIYGSSYSQGGMKDKKGNTAEDLMAVMKHMVAHGYTTQSQLGLFGGTDAGVAIGACLACKPTAFAAAVVQDGLFDLIKYHRFNPPLEAPGGRPRRSKVERAGLSAADEQSQPWRHSLWYKEFGCAEDSTEECRRMLELSPLHALGARSASTFSYPAVLLSVGDASCGNSVSYKHSMKFAAELQRTFGSQEDTFKPLLLQMPARTATAEEDVTTTATTAAGGESNSAVDVTAVATSGRAHVYAAAEFKQMVMQFSFLAQNIVAEGQS